MEGVQSGAIKSSSGIAARVLSDLHSEKIRNLLLRHLDFAIATFFLFLSYY